MFIYLGITAFLEENKLICVNSLPLTKGLITRKRRYLDETRQSTIDFYVVCDKVLPYVSSMEIVNDKKHNLTNYSLLNKKSEAISSDHAPLIMEVKLEARAVQKEKVEIHNFEEKESQLQFKKNTSETTVFTDCFETLQPVCQQSEQWLSLVKAHVNK